MSDKCYDLDPTCKIYRPEKMSGKIDLKLKLTALHIPLLNDI